MLFFSQFLALAGIAREILVIFVSSEVLGWMDRGPHTNQREINKRDSNVLILVPSLAQVVRTRAWFSPASGRWSWEGLCTKPKVPKPKVPQGPWGELGSTALAGNGHCRDWRLQ